MIKHILFLTLLLYIGVFLSSAWISFFIPATYIYFNKSLKPELIIPICFVSGVIAILIPLLILNTNSDIETNPLIRYLFEEISAWIIFMILGIANAIGVISSGFLGYLVRIIVDRFIRK